MAASILAADFSRMGEDAGAALAAGADLLHVDVMDGHFVPNLTMGPDMVRALRRSLPAAFIDVHLMVTDPGAFVAPFVQAGAGHLTFHIEAVPDPAPLAAAIRAAGATAGLSLNPPTDASRIIPFVHCVDLVLVMSVNPGFAGQRFMPQVLDKARRIGPLLRPAQRLQIDGGVNDRTSGDSLAAGCDCLVAASAIFGEADYAAAISRLRRRPVRPGSG